MTQGMKYSNSEKQLKDAVRDVLKKHKMVKPGSGILLGVSGGPDSIAMLHIMHSLSWDEDFRIAVAHLDHGLRPESEEEAEFVKETAAGLGSVCYVKRVDVRGLAVKEGMSVEEAGRTARYSFLESVRSETGCRVIGTAHHRDDEIETFLLRLFRGSSLQGLGGIPRVRGRIIRPLIGTDRAAITAFLRDGGIPYRTDPTNLDSDTDRNFVRNRILPVIRERFPDFAGPLSRTMDLIRKENLFLDELCDELFNKVVTEEERGLCINAADLCAAPEPLATRTVLRALYEVSGPRTRWTRNHVESVLETAGSANPSGKLNLPGGLVVRREYDRLRLIADPALDPQPAEIEVHGPGTIEIPWAGIRFTFKVIDIESVPVAYPAGRHTVWFDAEEQAFPLKVRSRRPGDRFSPWGMEGSRKLKKELMESKVPVDRRANLALLVKGEEIIWIAGIRRSRFGAVGSGTRRVLEVSMDT